MAGRQRKDLHAALLSAFPSEDDFARIVDLEMEVRLDDISAPAAWPTRLLNAINWTESQNRLDELVAVAKAAQPHNPDLLAYFQRWPTTPKRLAAAPAFALPTNTDQLERLMRFAIPWFAMVTVAAVVLFRNPSETVLMFTMSGLLILAVVSIASPFGRS